MTAARDRLTVLVSVAPTGTQTNPYITQLFDAIAADADVVRFSFRSALLGRWDVFHIHWPENAMRRPGRLTTFVRTVLFALVLVRARLSGRPIVRTRHNTAPHEAGPWPERPVLALGDRWTSRWISLSPSVGAPDGGDVTVIPHGHYRDWYARHPRPRPVPGRLLYFGLIRTYKGVPDLVDAVGASPDPELSLHVVGRIADAALRPSLVAAADADERIVVLDGYVDEAELAREIGEAQLIVLPYRELLNSGSVLLALSLDRPVLVPDTATMRDLAAEVGPGWVHLFRGRVTADDLGRALAAGVPTEPVRFDGREWPAAAAAHLAAYRSALGESGPELAAVRPGDAERARRQDHDVDR